MNDNEKVRRERLRLLVQIDRILDGPMLILGLLWLMLLIVELVWRTTPLIDQLTWVLWGVFVVEYLIKLAIAPARMEYVKRNWIGLLSLAVPAFRVLRVVRVLRLARFARASRLVRILSTVNHSMRTLRMTMRRRQLGYVLALFVLVDVVGAAGMYAFERDVSGSPLVDYATSLWWTTMLLTTLGSDYWPRSGEGRILCTLLAFFAIGTLGYVTAALASFFIGSDVSRRRKNGDGSSQG